MRSDPEAFPGLVASVDRAVVLGANGWFGRNAVDVLEAAWGKSAAGRMKLFARGEHAIELSSGETIPVRPIAELRDLGPAPGTLMIDCAYPTQEKVDQLGVDAYLESVGELRRLVTDEVERLEPHALVSLSSGAALAGPDAPERTRIYGEMKRRDENQLVALCPRIGTRLCIARVYAASGPHMTKPESYALGDLIRQVRAGGPVRVLAARPVYRSYSLASDVLAVAVAAALGADPLAPILFETGGEEIEVGDLADRVASVLHGAPMPVDRPELEGAPEDRYVGDPSTMEKLAGRYGIVLAGLDEQIEKTADDL